MVCLGLEPGAAGWKAQTNPLSYSGTPYFTFFYFLKSVDDVLGIRTRGRRMVGADETTELWRLFYFC